ncbi:MAG: hypothetical protein D6732_14130 [Methanobacteriota archaeon]|nr:MAG: hypothetical protein D6732_14130 [Euryarchaeota archaeon]
MALTIKYVSSQAAGGGTGDSEASPYTLAEAISWASANSNFKIYVKADGTYSLSGAQTLGGVASNTAKAYWEGYQTSVGDGISPTLVNTDNVWTIGSNVEVRNFIFKASSTTFTTTLSDRAIAINTKHINTRSDVWGGKCLHVSKNALCIGFEADGSASANTSTQTVVRTYGTVSRGIIRHGTGGVGLEVQLNYTVYFGEASFVAVDGLGLSGSIGIKLLLENAGAAYRHFVLSSCTVYNTSHGIELGPFNPDYTSSVPKIVNCLIYNCDYGIYNADATNQFVSTQANAFGAITTAKYYQIAEPDDPREVNLTANPFVDTTNTPHDLSLNNNAGGGQLCKEAGIGLPVT